MPHPPPPVFFAVSSALIGNGDVVNVAPVAAFGETLPPQAVLSYHFSPNTEAQVQVRKFGSFFLFMSVTYNTWCADKQAVK